MFGSNRESKLRSPCIAVCAIDPISGLCEGCLRTLDEISEWRFMPDDKKQTVLDALPSRVIPGREDAQPQTQRP